MRETKTYVAVAFNLPVEKFFWYILPSRFKRRLIKRGQRVVVPFGSRQILGFVVEESSRRPQGKLREVKDLFDRSSPFSETLFQLARWISDYYSCSLGQALHSIFPFSFPYKEEKPLFNPSRDSLKREEVYLVKPGKNKFDFILSVIKDNKELQKQVIILVPEISLLATFQERLKRWKVKAGIFHSRLSPKQRYYCWLAMKKGEFDVAVGTRSLVFAPFPDIGSILIDEEESTDYKQKETPKYNVCQVAIKRGELENFPVYLVTDSPSLESWYRAKKKIYRTITFSNNEKEISSFKVVDLKKEKKENRIFSSILREEMKEALKRKLPVLLFVPRRGYANFLLCDDCGEVIRCPNCNTGLSFHIRGEMVCHLCGFREKAPKVCPFCGGRNLKKVGWGTQRVELETRRIFPEARVERFDFDTFKSSPHLIPSKIREEKIDILVGTQLLMKEEIISVSGVVAIILLDVLLNLPDFRATEHAFQLLNKISRSLNKNSSLIIQTYNPSHYVLSTKTCEDFYLKELEIRKTLRYPPFQRWIRFLLEGRVKSKVKDRSEGIAREIRKENIDFLGPSPCPFSRIKGKYRYHIILRDDGLSDLQQIIKRVNLGMMKGSVKVGVDVDPLFIV